jgi:hypothetical protein
MKLKVDPGFCEAKKALEGEKSQLAFLIGNGINYIGSASGGISWDQLIDELISWAAGVSNSQAETIKMLKRLIERGSSGRTAVSLPEAFDILTATLWIKQGVASGYSAKVDLQAKISELLKDMKPSDAHKALYGWAVHAQAPILTTNYDHCIQDALNNRECKRRLFGTGNSMSDFYPWDRYYSPRKISDPCDEFALWHIHGDRRFRRSIRAGLDQYMGMVQRLRRHKMSVAKEVLYRIKKVQKMIPAFHKVPWLRIFMGKKLWIQGLAIREDEVSIRWLLIQRFRYWKRYKPDECLTNGWYIYGPTRKLGALDAERRLFFRSIGLKIFEIQNTSDVYRNLFKNQDQTISRRRYR